MSRARRERIEACVDGLLRLLDEIDGDADLEDNGDYEPSTSALTYDMPPWASGASGDLDECEPPEDPEPSLGWTATIDQGAVRRRGEPQGWRFNYAVEDGEEEHDGREPEPPEPNGDEEDFSGYYGEPGACPPTTFTVISGGRP